MSYKTKDDREFEREVITVCLPMVYLGVGSFLYGYFSDASGPSAQVADAAAIAFGILALFFAPKCLRSACKLWERRQRVGRF